MKPRLSEQLCATASTWTTGADAARHRVPDEIRELITLSPRVLADQAAALHWGRYPDVWSFERLGPIRPPFDEMWIEYRAPDAVYLGHQWKPPPFDHVGIYLWTAPMSEIDWSRDLPASVDAHGATRTGQPFSERIREADRFLRARIVIKRALDGLVDMGVDLWNFIDNDGRWMINMLTNPRDQRGRPGLQELGEAIIDAAKPCFIALALMNCKNVAVGEVEAPAALARQRARKRGLPTFRHHLVHVPGVDRETRPRPGVQGAPIPLHMVRGHFKTFTPAAPLLGRHVGTYWWDSAIRGDQRHGIRSKDYLA